MILRYIIITKEYSPKGTFLTQKVVLEFKNNDLVPFLFGEFNNHLAHLEKNLNISIADRGNRLMISGEREAVNKARIALQSLYTRLEDRELHEVTAGDIDAELRFLSTGGKSRTMKHKTTDDQPTPKGVIKTRNKTIIPRSPNQARYLDMIREKDMVFGLGPAGTGKTYLAVAAAVDMYLQGKIERMVFCRPAVEAGENLGFLPGDMKEKVDPYLRPIYDALQDMLPSDLLAKKMETGEIEIAPLAFMRGRTLARAFVILDEAQNSTTMQMKMFLTRMGEASHMVITGDITQSDLPRNVPSGLNDAIALLQDIPEIGFLTFEHEDVIRHPLVKKIIQAYDKVQR